MSDTEQKLPLEVDEVPTSDANADPQTGEEKHQPVPDISELSSEKLDHDMQVFTQNEPSQTDCNPIDADTVQPMTYEEMVQLRNIIDSMPKVKFNHVVNILRQREPSYRDCRPDEILIDFNALQQSTLLELKQYAIEYLQECKLEGGNAEARQEIRRLIELKRVQDRFERAVSNCPLFPML